MKGPVERLAKMLAYVLGRRPDEFGLVTDPEGFVKIKDLLKALGEEEGLRHIRRGALEEILVTMPEPPIEIQEGRVRARDRAHLAPHAPPDTLPKLLYTCVRRKAYPVVLENGISPGSHPMVLLSSDQDMARRIGRRNDGAPVMLTVSVSGAREAGVRFLSAGGACILPRPFPRPVSEARRFGGCRMSPHPGNRAYCPRRPGNPAAFSPVRPRFFPGKEGTGKAEGENGPNGSGIENGCSEWSKKRVPASKKEKKQPCSKGCYSTKTKRVFMNSSKPLFLMPAKHSFRLCALSPRPRRAP